MSSPLLDSASVLSRNVDVILDDEIDPNLFWSDGTVDGPPANELAQYQVCVIAIKCKHNAMLLSRLHSPDRSEGLWLPYVALKDRYMLTELPAFMAEFVLHELRLVHYCAPILCLYYLSSFCLQFPV